MYPNDYPDYSKTPDVPTCMDEAAHATQELHAQVRAIKRVLHVQGMGPANWDEPWHVPLSDGQLFATVTRLIVDIQMIKLLLIEGGLASEKDMVPLSPRWRIDGRKQHYRNVKIFEQCVRLIIDQEKKGMPEGSFTHSVNRHLGQDENERPVK